MPRRRPGSSACLWTLFRATPGRRIVAGQFDHVLCMGPLYHLIEEADREPPCAPADLLRVGRSFGFHGASFIYRPQVFIGGMHPPYIRGLRPRYPRKRLLFRRTCRRNNDINSLTPGGYAAGRIFYLCQMTDGSMCPGSGAPVRAIMHLSSPVIHSITCRAPAAALFGQRVHQRPADAHRPGAQRQRLEYVRAADDVAVDKKSSVLAPTARAISGRIISGGTA